jgi:hypothetical protein
METLRMKQADQATFPNIPVFEKHNSHVKKKTSLQRVRLPF